MRRTALILGLLAALVLAALALILTGFYSSPNKSSTINASSGVTTESFVPCGFQDSSYQPHGCWAAYLGFIPPGYTIAPHLAHGATYPCPSGMTASQCRQFLTSCGNGVCDPNESCGTCPIDCPVSGNLACDQWTKRADIPVMVCQGVG